MERDAIFVSDSVECIHSTYTARQINGCSVYSGVELLARRHQEVQYLFSTWGMPRLTAGQIEHHLPGLRAVFYAAGSIQAFARPFLQRGVRVFSAARANALPVAQFVAAQIILAGKGYFQMPSRYRSGYTAARAFAEKCKGNYGGRVGLLGAGMVGREVIRLLLGSGLGVLVYDPFLDMEQAKALGVQKASLAEVFSTCQVVSNHLADNAETKNLLDYSLFSLMQPQAVFINTGRGAQVVQQDLLRWAAERPDCTALLDVTSPEPLPPGSPLLCADNILVTPHIAGSVGDELRRLGETMLEAHSLLLEGKSPDCEVFLDELYRKA